MKICTKCSIEKAPSSFYSDRTHKDGLGTRCKSCVKAAAILVADKRSAYNKDHYKKNREAILARHKQTYNPQERQAYSNQYRKDNLERCKKSSRDYNKLNRASINAQKATRRAEKRFATPKWHEKHKIKQMYGLSQLFNSFGLHTHVDHIVPLGGTHVCGLHCIDNLQILPAKLNLIKGNRHSS